MSAGGTVVNAFLDTVAFRAGWYGSKRSDVALAQARVSVIAFSVAASF